MTWLDRTGKALAFSLVVTALLGPGSAHGQEKSSLDSLSVDDLMNVEVTSVARKSQKLSDTPAAVFVITAQDIRRSGASTIPDILRMVPGLQVARVNGNIWAVSARGSSNRFANKMLVLIDGRSVYSPVFSGVFWDVQDTPLEDIERIEVIRGPGGTLWGANAVNGIINIITRHSIDTQGTLVTAGGSADVGMFGTIRHGGSFTRNGYYRAYVKSFDRPESAAPGGAHPHDEWDQVRGGYRADWVSGTGDNFTAQGDLYRGTSEEITNVVDADHPIGPAIQSLNHVQGADLLFRWSSVQSSRSETSLQVYFDATKRRESFLQDDRKTFDLDFQHHLKLGTRDEGVWGLGFRGSRSKTTSLLNIGIFGKTPGIGEIASAFAKNDFALTQRFHLTVGTKVEYTQTAGLQFQPTIRALINTSAHSTLWGAATSAVRTPSQSELGWQVNLGSFEDQSGKPGLIVIFPNPNLRSERVDSYEAGARWRPLDDTSIDAALFHNEMRQIHGTQPSSPYLDANHQLIVPLAYTDTGSGHSNGAEIFVSHTATTNWHLTAGYSLFSAIQTPADIEPKHQVRLGSNLRITPGFELDSALYFIDHVDGDSPRSSYTRLDVQLSWRRATWPELSLVGQNLLNHDQDHIEASGLATLGTATPVRRSIYGKVTWRF